MFFVLVFTGQFTEDGSFIGQYVPGRLQPPVSPQPIMHGAAGAPGMMNHSSNSGGAATYV